MTVDATDPAGAARDAVERAWRDESRRVLATLVRLLGDFERAEEALHDAFAAALERWPHEGLPRNARAWLVSAGRFRAIDALRRRARWDAREALVAAELEAMHAPADDADDERSVADDRLRMIFTCCHPALAAEARAALVLREVCGLTTEAVARAYLVPAATVAQRIVRAKAKIREARIPYEVPPREALPARLDAVLQVLYLVFTAGYAEGAGEGARALASEAIRLARELRALLPEREVAGLLALMLLHEARAATRADDAGELVLLAAQDRTRWDRAMIAEGGALVREALAGGAPGPYAVQAAIAALHAEALTAADTDWREIVALYDVLLRLVPTHVVALNRAVAVGERDGAAAGLALVEALLADGTLARWHLAHAARGALLARLARADEARAAYATAFALAPAGAERRFLAARLAAS